MQKEKNSDSHDIRNQPHWAWNLPSVVKLYYLHLIILPYKSSLKKQKKRFTSLKVVLYSFMQWSVRFNHKRRHRRGSRKKWSLLHSQFLESRSKTCLLYRVIGKAQGWSRGLRGQDSGGLFRSWYYWGFWGKDATDRSEEFKIGWFE